MKRFDRVLRRLLVEERVPVRVRVEGREHERRRNDEPEVADGRRELRSRAIVVTRSLHVAVFPDVGMMSPGL